MRLAFGWVIKKNCPTFKQAILKFNVKVQAIYKSNVDK